MGLQNHGVLLAARKLRRSGNARAGVANDIGVWEIPRRTTTASVFAVAVALDGGGLHTPVLRDAEIKSLSEISNEMRDLAARARSKRLAPHEYQGGSTTISNLGMYGIDRFDAVINPPQASIMAVGRAEKRPVVKDDALKIATMMSVTLSVDHRVIDGALGAELLAAFKAYIEDPVTMLV